MKREERIKQVITLVNKGFTRNEVIERLHISKRTLERYQEENTEIATKIKENEKEISKLIKTAFKVANGYTIKVPKVIKCKEGQKVIEVNEHVQPSPDMIKYLLNNRDKLNFSNNPNKDKVDNEMLELKKKEFKNKNILGGI